jgi:glutamate synthase (NADPH/NADH) large chain
MSGGVAYVLDLDEGRVNRELVDLGTLDDETAARVLHLITRHAEETGSTVAQAVALEWSSARHRVTEVMPRDYRRVLVARAAAERDGLSETEAAAAMMGALDG